MSLAAEQIPDIYRITEEAVRQPFAEALVSAVDDYLNSDHTRYPLYGVSIDLDEAPGYDPIYLLDGVDEDTDYRTWADHHYSQFGTGGIEGERIWIVESIVRTPLPAAPRVPTTHSHWSPA